MPSSFRLGFCGNQEGAKTIKNLHFLLDKRTWQVLAYKVMETNLRNSPTHPYSQIKRGQTITNEF